MVIKALFNLIYNLFSAMTSPLQIPQFSPEVSQTLDSATQYIESGLSYVAAWTHWQFIIALFVLALAVGAFIRHYGLIMWILRKIPFLDVG